MHQSASLLPGKCYRLVCQLDTVDVFRKHNKDVYFLAFISKADKTSFS